jgi:hypothetical protein
MTAFGLAVPWILIAMMYVPKEIMWYLGQLERNIQVIMEYLDTQQRVINMYILINSLLTHGFFIYLTYIFRLSFFALVSISFITMIILYFVIDIALRRHLEKVLKQNEHEVS